MRGNVLLVLTTLGCLLIAGCPGSSDPINSVSIAWACVDSQNNLYIMGRFYRAFDFAADSSRDVHSSIGRYDRFVARYDSSNHLAWLYTWRGGTGYGQMQGPDNDYVKTMAVDPAGNLYLGGRQDCYVPPNPSSLPSRLSNEFFLTGSMPNQSNYIAKVNPDGSTAWANDWGGQTDLYLEDMKIENSGDILALGQYTGEVDFDPGPGQEIAKAGVWRPGWDGNVDFFICRFKPDGTFMSVTNWADDVGVFAPTIVKLDSQDNRYLAGVAEHELDVDPGPGEALVKIDASEPSPGWMFYLTKQDRDGNFQWLASWAPDGVVVHGIEDILIDQSGNVYVAGELMVLPGPHTAQPIVRPGMEFAFVGFLLKFDPAGKLLWKREWGGGGSTQGAHVYSVSMGTGGDLDVMGSVSGTVDFDPGDGRSELTGSGITTYCQTRFTPDGDFIDARLLDSNADAIVINQSRWEIFGQVVNRKMTSSDLDSLRKARMPNAVLNRVNY